MQATSAVRVMQVKVIMHKIVQYVDKIEIGAENDKIDCNTWSFIAIILHALRPSWWNCEVTHHKNPCS